MPRSDGLRILSDFWKKQLVEIWSWTKWVDFWAWVRPGQLGQWDVPRMVGSDGTVSIVKIMSYSPRVKNLKVKKVIKVSYLNQESRQCFECFLDSYAYEHSMHPYVLHIVIMAMIHSHLQPISNLLRNKDGRLMRLILL